VCIGEWQERACGGGEREAGKTASLTTRCLLASQGTCSLDLAKLQHPAGCHAARAPSTGHRGSVGCGTQMTPGAHTQYTEKARNLPCLCSCCRSFFRPGIADGCSHPSRFLPYCRETALSEAIDGDRGYVLIHVLGKPLLGLRRHRFIRRTLTPDSATCVLSFLTQCAFDASSHAAVHGPQKSDSLILETCMPPPSVG
jgi:hypothetical protein